MAGRRTPIERWELSLPYFDGMCEVLLGPQTRCDRSGNRRCQQPACAESEGFAVCRTHAQSIKETHNFIPDAGAFRFEHLVEHVPIAIPESQWDF